MPMRRADRSGGIGVLITSFALLAVPTAWTAGTKPAVGQPGHRREYPLYLAGLVVGMSSLRDAQRMYGEGFRVEDEGHGGGYYYVDTHRQVTLHVVTGVDRILEEISYERGVRLPAGSLKRGAIPQTATSPNLSAGEQLFPGYHLGDPPDGLLQSYGKAAKDVRTGRLRIIRYESDYKKMPYVLVYEAELRFEAGKLVFVRLYNGD